MKREKEPRGEKKSHEGGNRVIRGQKEPWGEKKSHERRKTAHLTLTNMCYQNCGFKDA